MGSDARGEGLAGLMGELQTLADKTYAPGGPGHEEFEKGLRTAYLIAAGKVQNLAALEAAAPPSTARERELLQAVLDCETCHNERGHAYLKVPARSLNDLGALIGAALATSSPQAPPSKCSCDPETGRRDPNCKVCAPGSPRKVGEDGQ